MTSHDVMVTNKLYLRDKNNHHIVLCKLGSHTISGCRVTGVRTPEPPRSWEAKKPGLNRVNIYFLIPWEGCPQTRACGAYEVGLSRSKEPHHQKSWLQV